MDKRLLDPRRARRAPTAEDRAEQLAPYAEELPVAPAGYATFDRQVANLRGAAGLAALSLSCTRDKACVTPLGCMARGVALPAHVQWTCCCTVCNS